MAFHIQACLGSGVLIWKSENPTFLQLATQIMAGLVVQASMAKDQFGDSDSGGASFLGEVHRALKELKESGEWSVPGIPEPQQLFAARLASNPTHNLPELSLPISVPGTPEEGSATVVCPIRAGQTG